MKDIFFFDADCRIGTGPDYGQYTSVADLISDMNDAGVDKALVAYGFTSRLGAVQSNIEIAKLLRDDTEKRLYGVWTMLPSQCDELPPPDELFRQMKENRVVALNLFPQAHRYVPCRLTLGKLMDAAAERKIPVLVKGFNEQWDLLYSFMKDFPKNRIILSESYGKWGDDRLVRPLLENYPEFYFGMSGYWVPEGIRDLAERYGTNRILFSSGYPQYAQGSSMLQLKHSGLDAESIAAIAGKNLERMISEVQL